MEQLPIGRTGVQSEFFESNFALFLMSADSFRSSVENPGKALVSAGEITVPINQNIQRDIAINVA